jgi:hypothetical protein
MLLILRIIPVGGGARRAGWWPFAPGARGGPGARPAGRSRNPSGMAPLPHPGRPSAGGRAGATARTGHAASRSQRRTNSHILQLRQTHRRRRNVNWDTGRTAARRSCPASSGRRGRGLAGIRSFRRLWVRASGRLGRTDKDCNIACRRGHTHQWQRCDRIAGASRCRQCVRSFGQSVEPGTVRPVSGRRESSDQKHRCRGSSGKC